jgi:hypothetical protein
MVMQKFGGGTSSQNSARQRATVDAAGPFSTKFQKIM